MGAAREPLEVVAKEEVEMQAVVAELMIAANAAVAQRIHAAFPSAALLRRHPQPRMEGLKPLMEVTPRNPQPTAHSLCRRG